VKEGIGEIGYREIGYREIRVLRDCCMLTVGFSID